MTESLFVKRVYDSVSPTDGMRVLVDRLWPRGLKKEDAVLDAWLKAIAPSPELRTWFGHRADHFDEFRTLYLEELRGDPAHADAVKQVLRWLADSPVTLLYAAKDEQHNHTIVLHDFLSQRLYTKGFDSTEASSSD